MNWWREQPRVQKVVWLVLGALWVGLWYYAEGLSVAEKVALAHWLGLR